MMKCRRFIIRGISIRGIMSGWANSMCIKNFSVSCIKLRTNTSIKYIRNTHMKEHFHGTLQQLPASKVKSNKQNKSKTILTTLSILHTCFKNTNLNFPSPSSSPRYHTSFKMAEVLQVFEIYLKKVCMPSKYLVCHTLPTFILK